MEYNLFWFGVLTPDNLEEVAELFRQLLAEKRFVVVESSQHYHFKPSVAIGQKLLLVLTKKHRNVVTMEITTSAGSFTLSSTTNNELFSGHDHENAFISFSGHKVVVTQRSLETLNLSHWVFAVEPASEQPSWEEPVAASTVPEWPGDR